MLRVRIGAPYMMHLLLASGLAYAPPSFGHLGLTAREAGTETRYGRTWLLLTVSDGCQDAIPYDGTPEYGAVYVNHGNGWKYLCNAEPVTADDRSTCD